MLPDVPTGVPDGRDSGAPDPLRDLVTSCCDVVPTANNLPIAIDDPDVAWFVECGALDVFVVEHRDGAAASALAHMLHADAGRLVFGVGDNAGTELRVIVKGVPGTRLRRVPLDMLSGAPRLDRTGDAHAAGRTPAPGAGVLAPVVIREVDAWIEAFAASVARDIEVHPPADARLAPGAPTPAAGVLSADRNVVWLAGADLTAAFLGLEKALPGGPRLMPVTPATWVVAAAGTEGAEAPASAAATVLSSEALVRDIGIRGLLETALAEFHRLAIGTLAIDRQLSLVDDANLRRASSVWRDLDEHAARRRLRDVVLDSESRRDAGSVPLVAALNVVARHHGVAIRVPERDPGRHDPLGLQEILDFSGLRCRRVRLAPGDRWWLGDSGAMLAFRRPDGRPVALLPSAAGRYRVYDPATGTTSRLSAGTAREFEEDGWLLYRPVAGIAPGSAAGVRDLFRVVGAAAAADVRRLLATGLVTGLLTLTPAIAIGVLIDRVIPVGEIGLLVQFTLALAGVALISALAHVLRGTAVMRLEGRATARLTAALMDRVLRLPASVLRRFTAGDLGMRVATFHRIRDRLAGPTAGALLSAIFLLPALVVIFFYSTTLGWLSLALGTIVLLAAATAAAAQIGPNRRYFSASRRLAGSVLQFIIGVGKLRSARAEGAAFAVWARLYQQQKQAEVELAARSEHVAALSAALPTLAGAIVIAVMLADPARLPLADFLVVYAVSSTFFVTLTALGAAFESIAAFAPSCGEVEPILAAEVESARSGSSDVRLTGDLLFDHVCFRYDANGPDILHDVTIRAAPGESIAIVGESGSGKSTLVRLALGLETPLSGGVYYDGRNLARLDAAAVRRQIGVVPQDIALQPGTILSNITGSAEDLTLADVWRAARLAAVDEDIAAMPMGMHTPVSENGNTLSGGQRQRLAIASALARRPPIVVLDEATSWLDSATQEEAMARIEATAVTRVVIAHRLSTARNANRIYVLRAGRVVQEGTFEELSATDGPFRELMRRQTT